LENAKSLISLAGQSVSRIRRSNRAIRAYAVDTLALYTGYLGGSNHLQGTKPETVGFALADCPAGQAAWIYEKFQSKTTMTGSPRTR
jgi:hypothetical protein